MDTRTMLTEGNTRHEDKVDLGTKPISPPPMATHTYKEALSQVSSSTVTALSAKRKKQCASCFQFVRGEWYKAIGGGLMEGGYCDLLTAILGVSNPQIGDHAIYGNMRLYVQDTFGCIMHRLKS